MGEAAAPHGRGGGGGGVGGGGGGVVRVTRGRGLNIVIRAAGQPRGVLPSTTETDARPTPYMYIYMDSRYIYEYILCYACICISSDGALAISKPASAVQRLRDENSFQPALPLPTQTPTILPTPNLRYRCHSYSRHRRHSPRERQQRKMANEAARSRHQPAAYATTA